MKNLFRAVCLFLICLVSAPLLADPIGTSFTYQGELNYQGQPVNEAFNFQFSLWDSHEGGDLVGQGMMLFLDSVPVVNGVFTVELDFETNIYTDQQIWLQIEVQHPESQEPPEILSPRQPLRPAPFALTAGHVVNLTSNQCDDRSYLVGFGPNNELVCRSGTALHCGDGQVTPPEDCDDGNLVDDDGCSSDCRLPPYLVFLTGGERFEAPAVSGGLDPITGADSTCQGAADLAGLEGVFKAWISTCTWTGSGYDCISPNTHWVPHGFPLARVDGVRVANSLTDIFFQGRELLAPINTDAYGNPVGGDPLPLVFTGTDETGLDPRSFEAQEGQTWCDEWTSTEGAFLAGDYSATDSTWTNDSEYPCLFPARLYCFQQSPEE